MVNILKELELEELSIVDRPANPLAKAPLFKRDTQSEGDYQMSDKMKERMKYYMEEKGMSEEDARKACMEEMEKSMEEANAMRKFLLDEGYRITKNGIEKRKEDDYVEYKGEKIHKSDDRFDLVQELKKAEEERKDIDLTKRASEELPHFDQEVAKSFLKFDLDDKMIAALQAADKAFEAAMG